MPGIWDQYLDQFQKLLVLRCLRGDKVTNAMQDFVAANLEPAFIEPQASATSQCPRLILTLGPRGLAAPGQTALQPWSGKNS